jgi:NDP-sugar pyrophosphorylase family protein
MTATEATLVVLAAGRGTRFGGPKQLVAVRDDGSTITDILLRRAAAAGVEHAAIVVNPDIEGRFRSHLDAMSHGVRVDVVIQPRPSGTADAVLVTRNAVPGPLVVVNADDIYPAGAFSALAAHLVEAPPHEHAAVGFRLDRTRIASRPESRALLDVDESGVLRHIRETQVERSADGTFSTTGAAELVAGDQLVSMNIWAFRPSVFDALSDAVREHDRRDADGEVFLPDVVAAMVGAGAIVRVLPTEEPCVSLTYPDDLDAVRSAT